MKRPSVIFACVFIVFALVVNLHAQDGNTATMLQAIQATTPVPASFATNGSNFYSAQHAPDTAEPWPPLPGNIRGLDVWALGDGFFLLDDREVDYSDLSQLQGRGGMQTMSMDPNDPGDGDGTNTYTPNFFPPFTPTTNDLWLQITNVASGLAYVNLNNATNYVYEIWNKTDLSFTNWNIELGVWPTNKVVMPFIVPELGRTNLYIWARDWTGITSNGNLTPEWWFWKYFGTLALSDTNLDTQGNTLYYDYTNSSDPNIINFLLMATNNYVNNMSVPLELNIIAGTPSYMAVSVDNTNYASASTWQAYTGTNLAVNLGLTEGWHDVWVGLKGLPSDATRTWVETRLKLDFTPPTILVTNPVAGGTVSVPMLQVQGYSPETLSSITYDITNAAGLLTNRLALVVQEFYDTNQTDQTTNYFQCYDIPLTNGLNTIIIHATDLAGNTSSTNVSYTLNYSMDHVAPVFSVVWPQAGAAIGGSQFTVHGKVDDIQAKISALIVDASGNTNTVAGQVQRSGTVWINNLPLSAGTNSLIVTATDAAGNVSLTNLTLYRSGVLVTVNPLASDQLNQSSVSVSGTVSVTNSTVYVNGILATVNSNGVWSADEVPVGAAGMAVFDVQASVGGTNGLTEAHQPQPATVGLKSYSGSQVYVYSGTSSLYWYDTVNWSYDVGGHWSLNDSFLGPDSRSFPPSENGNAPIDPPWQYSFLFGVNGSGKAFVHGSPGTPSAWVPFSWTWNSIIQTRVMIQPSDMSPTDQTSLYLVRACALEVSDAKYGEDTLLNFNSLFFYNQSGYDGDMPLPPEWLKINNKKLVNSGLMNEDGAYWGETVVSGPQGANVDVTPTATRLFGYNDYTFNVQAQELQLKIVDASSGTDLTAQTNTVIVGQQINLRCQWSLTNAVLTNFPLANFQWTVPGNTFSDYVATVESAVLYTNFPTTHSNVLFYWSDGATNRTVQCSATINGQRISAQATFNVLRPEVTWTLTPKDTVAVDTNFDADPIFNGYYFLRTGKNFSTNDVGMLYAFQVTDLKGITNDYNFQFYQITTIDWRKNIQFTEGTNSYALSQSVAGTAYDEQFPYPWHIYSKTNGYATDTPADPLTADIAFLWRADRFEDYLMFTPVGGKPVPIKMAAWNWYGRAQRTNSTSPPTFVGVTPFTNAQAAIGIDCFIYPTWITNVANLKTNWQSHLSLYPTP
ncbi:MAG: hypothetical protein WDM80_15110 [Limisphaerales bacterium]